MVVLPYLIVDLIKEMHIIEVIVVGLLHEYPPPPSSQNKMHFLSFLLCKLYSI